MLHLEPCVHLLDFPLTRVHPLMGLDGGWGLSVMKLTNNTMASKKPKSNGLDLIIIMEVHRERRRRQ